MLKNVIMAAAVAFAAPAFAVSASGFEGGSTDGWVPPGSAPFVVDNFGGLTSQLYGSTVSVVEDLYDGGGAIISSTPYDFTVTSAGAGFGNSFGVLTTGTTSAAGYRVNLLDAPSSAGDVFAMQLFTWDYDADYNDSATVSFYIGSTMIATQSWTALESLGQPSGVGASGWKPYFVPVGTTSIEVALANGAPAGFGADNGNAPVLALDYAAAAPVPEPETYGMMLAGLGVMGFIARRRKQKAAKA